jgi:putative ABC transport system substrate-binding protein
MFMNLPQDDREISGRREAFLQGVGPLPGLTVATRFGAGDYRNYRQKALDLSMLKVDGAGPDVYFATCWPSLRALRGVAGNTPIVFTGVADLRDDPINGNTDYASNVYGFISFGKNLCGDWVRLLRAVKPDVTRAAVLYDTVGGRPAGPRPRAQKVYDEIVAQGWLLNPALDATREINSGSQTLRADLEAFATQARQDGTPAGLIVAESVVAANNRQTIIDVARELKLPVVCPNRLYAFQGALVSRGTHIQDLYRSAGDYARRLINQDPPSPRIEIAQTGRNPQKMAVFETIINAEAAAAIGLTVDAAMLARVKPDLVIDPERNATS